MNWYKGIFLCLGMLPLQAMEPNEKNTATEPQTMIERLDKAVTRTDFSQVKQFLLKMEGTLSSDQKRVRVQKADALVQEYENGVYLSKSMSDRRAFIAYGGAFLVSAALTYVGCWRIFKKSQAFNDANNLEYDKNLHIARKVITDCAQQKVDTNQLKALPSAELIEAHAKEAAYGWKFSYDAEGYHARSFEVRKLIDRAQDEWWNNHGEEFRQAQRKIENDFIDLMASSWATLGLGYLSYRFGRKALEAFDCPNARKRLKDAQEIKQELQLVEVDV